MTDSAESIQGVLMSGGLDSSILLAWKLQQSQSVQPFYIRSGVAWEAAELRGVKRFLADCQCSQLRPLIELEMPLHDLYAGHWSITGRDVPDAISPDEAVYLPGRNAMLLVKAAIWCQLHGVRSLALATLGTSPFGDASTEFVNRFQSAINCGAAREVELQLPFAHLNKRQVMELGREFPLHHTFSCIAPQDGLHCGKCNKCAERQQAFRLAGIEDPTRYAQKTSPAGTCRN